MSEEKKPASPAVPPVPSATITPKSVVSLGNISVLVTEIRMPSGQTGFYVNPRRAVVQTGEDPSFIPVSQIPILIKLLEEIVTPAIQVRTFEQPTPKPEVPPPAANMARQKPKNKKAKR